MKHVVLLKSRSRHRGGLEKYAARIANAFLEKGSRVSVLTTGDSPPHPEIAFYAAKTLPWPSFLRMEQFDRFVGRWLQKNPADLVFGMERNRYQTHLRAGNGVHAAYLQSRHFTEGRMKVFLCHYNPLHRKILELEKAAFENPALQKLFTNSHMVRAQILDHYATDPKKIQVIHNGVEWREMETDFAEWQEGRARALCQFQLNPAQFHFLFIGNGYRRKGLGSLLLGLSRLPHRDFHLSVIGKDKEIAAYRARALQLGLQNQVRFFGPLPDVRPFYQLADALAIPSFYDPFANVTVEALAMGLHVISSLSNGGHEILTPETGTLIPDLLDPDAMVAALQNALQRPKTPSSASRIRHAVAHLDFSQQLRLLMDGCG